LHIIGEYKQEKMYLKLFLKEKRKALNSDDEKLSS
jgi:hypothetical protein